LLRKFCLLALGLAIPGIAGPLSESFFVVAQSGPLSKIFVSRRDGRDWRRLTHEIGSESDASYCSARGEVFYRKLLRGDWQLAAWNLRQAEGRMVHVFPGLDRQPVASPDGRRLAFTSDRYGNDEIMLLNLDATEEAIRLTWDQGEDSAPCWSPEGNRLVFTSRRNGQSDLYLYDLQNDQEQRLTRTEQDEVDPRWSPDGSKILFQTTEGRYRHGRLGWVDPSNREITMLPEAGGSAHQASWSPDGTRVLFLDYRSGRQPSSPALMTLSLSDRQTQPVILYRREMELTHWSFRQASWVKLSP